MAAYAATVTLTVDRALKIDQVKGIGILFGRVNITNYNTTRLEITGISKKFKTILAVIAGTTDSGHILEWIRADKAFKSYQFDYDAGADGPALEDLDDVDVGQAEFVAFGLI